MHKKKILLVGGSGMLAHDFIATQSDLFEIIPLGHSACDITDFSQVLNAISLHNPDVLLNCAAYTAVDDAEDIGRKANYDINTIGVYHLAKATSLFGIDFITISTDYVFDGTKIGWYLPSDEPNPLNAYGMAKYLGEKLAKEANTDTIIVRTSWLYGGGPEFKNFVNTMLRLGETRNELKVISDQFWSPTYTGDLCKAITEVIDNINEFHGAILQFSNTTPENGISWFEFATEIFKQVQKEINIIPCTTEEYKTKAARPKFSKMKNESFITLRDWKEGIDEYLNGL